jgi:adenosylcobyric acid synthase
MSNNARVVSGGEIGSAQYFQALAAGVVPEVLMNPVLLKPEKDTRSQVVILGRVKPALSRMPWQKRSARLWPVVRRSLAELVSTHEIVVIEGAGSPAEINLTASDIVNLRVARHAQARCLLVTDIDRGGAFAHLYGTWRLLSSADRKLIHGFVLNKFRGDANLLSPGPQKLQKLTGIPTVATLPMWPGHGLPEEDGVFEEGGTIPSPVSKTVAIVAYPRISNLDEFQSLRNIPGLHLRWARRPEVLEGADWIVLPGSKHTSSDLAWLRHQGMDQAVRAHASAGRAVLGICGGLQMLGRILKDRHGVDGNATGLGLLPLTTEFNLNKMVRRRQAHFANLTGLWASLSNIQVQGYEIHNGRTFAQANGRSARAVLSGGLAWQNAQGNILGLYLHGLFEEPAVLRALFGTGVPALNTVFDGLADFIDRHFKPGMLESLMDGSCQA